MIRILHIDDDGNDRELAEYRLTRLLKKVHILGAESGEEAIRLLELETFDCILCDYQMPVMNGLEVLQQVRPRFGDIPFIFLTGQGNEDVAAEALRSGADDYFAKGEGLLHFERLANSIRHHIDAHQLKHRQLKAKTRIEHLNLVLQAIRSVNRIITTATEAGPMLEKACSQLVETRGYRYSWVALFGEDTTIENWVVATDNGNIDSHKHALETGFFEREIDKACRSDEAVILKDAKCIDESCPDGSCNIMLKRLSHAGTTLGVICVALPTNLDVDNEETELFSELADDLALALSTFRQKEKRQKAEQALERTKANFQSVLFAVPGAIGVVTNRTFIWVNERMEEMLGYTAEELIGKNARMVYESEEEYQRVGKEKYSQIGKAGIGSVTTRWVRKDGSIVDIFMQSAPINPDDLSEGVTFVGTDISETVRIQKQAIVQERALKAVLESLPVFVHVHTADYRIKYVNEKFRHLFGNPENKKCYELLFGLTEPCESCNALEVIRTKKSNVHHWCGPNDKEYLVYSVPFESGDGETEVFEIGLDIEEKNQQLESLKIC